ncbi:hypothetical protein CABS03_14548 [Colletotrichum abscissum]|uniref:Uncharacterized protein n=2 Tax=Colletotrichum abscissum TaxID=1671311 RepID=A0A9P9X8Q0_9PEZI|nr:hypothetical protein CABS02_10681 [Colletotrichum abscissum]
MGRPGAICSQLLGAEEPTALQEYKTYSVFNCWRFLPCLVTNVDISAVDEPYPGGFHSIAFEKPDQTAPGVTRIVSPGGPQRHVSGTQPSWIPHLLPHTFATPDSSAPRSIGLGGDLPIILALLALMKRPGDTERVFWDGLWNRNGFHERRSSRADPDPTGSPRGVMVQICCDSCNDNSTTEMIEGFEARCCVIFG